jgi:apolipoprotein N-acyltransferase
MKLSGLFTFTALVALIFGIGSLLIPSQMQSIYGVELSTAGLFLNRLFGAALIGYGILSWLVRNEPKSPIRDAIVSAFFYSEAIGFVISLWGQFSGEYNALGWSVTAIYFLLALGFGYFRFMAPSEG